MQAYIQTKSTRADGTADSFSTTRAEHKNAPMRHHLQNLQFTATGYGKRIPTPHMVKHNGKWRRVYCCIFSNIGTLYIGKLSESLTVTLEPTA
jgi:hypothetical protein